MMLESAEEAPNPLQRFGALAIVAILAAATLLATLYGQGRAPFGDSFLPVAATVWSLANLLTAFLLLAQFYVRGSVFLAIAASAYAFTGFLSWAYLAAFPGLLRANAAAYTNHQVPIYLWLIWHFTFPVSIVCATVNDGPFGRIVSMRRIRLVTALVAGGPLILASAFATLVYAWHDALPLLVVGGRSLDVYRLNVVPSLVALNLIACAMLLARRTQLTPLRLCLAVALLSAAFDTYLGAGAVWNSYAWCVGKLITVFTSSVVLVMILCDIGGVYARIARIAKIDPLTSLANRRAFEEHFELVFRNARRLRTSMALLIVDVDLFKRFNDTYGHLAGDECLRVIARTMLACVTRPLDLVARYGGEEFVVVLPETTLAGAMILADRIRTSVEEKTVVYADSALPRVTVSIGVAFAPNASRVDATTLFEAADRGLYDAKDRGRNRSILGTTDSDGVQRGKIRVVLSAGANEPTVGQTL